MIKVEIAEIDMSKIWFFSLFQGYEVLTEAAEAFHLRVYPTGDRRDGSVGLFLEIPPDAHIPQLIY